MANIKFPRKEVEKHFKLDEKTLDRIMMLGIPVESLTADEIEIQVLPNRPDLLSMHGFIRAVKAFMGKETGLIKYKVTNSGYKLFVEKSLPKEWPYAVACIVKGLKFDDNKIKEIIDIQEKLGITLCRKRKKGGIGLYPLHKIAFPVRLKGIEPDKIKFQPLEMPQEMNGLQILQRHPTGREYAHLVEGWARFPVFVDNNNKIMSMPPIINSHDLGKIDENTTDVFIETTGPDFDTLKKAINIIVCALSDMGGKIYSIECIQQDGKKENIPDFTPEIMKIDINEVNKVTGLDLKEKDLEKLLPKMGYDYNKGKVSIPAYRTDILHEVDIIEDIAIAYGYENLVPEIPKVATIGEENRENLVNTKISDILAGLGFLEISTLHLVKQNEIEKDNKERIEVLDSKTEYKLLRPNLLIPGLRIFSENKDNEYPQKIFEIGKVFTLDKSSETGIKEPLHLFIASSPGNFTEIKQTLDYLFKMLNKKFEIKEISNKNLIEGRTGSILVNNKEIGSIGEVHPETLNNWGIKMPVALIEIDLTNIMN